MKPLYKHTIVIWSESPSEYYEDLIDLSREAISGDCFCSKQSCVKVNDPEQDEDWVGTEFFDDPEMDF